MVIFAIAQHSCWLSDDIVRFKIKVGVEEKCTKNVTPFPMDFPHTPQHAVHRAMTSLSLAGVCARSLLGRRVCKRVDVGLYVITLSCTWRIYALSERLLVIITIPHIISAKLQVDNPHYPVVVLRWCQGGHRPPQILPRPPKFFQAYLGLTFPRVNRLR